MTTTNGVGSAFRTTSHADSALRDIPIITAEELAAASILENQAQIQESARESQRAAQQLQMVETAARVAKLHEAADMAVFSGLLSAGANLASAAGGALGGGWDTVGKVGNAGCSAASTVLKGEADHDTADAAAHEALSQRAGEAARESADAEQSAERTADRALQQLGEVLETKRRAEEAATRA